MVPECAGIEADEIESEDAGWVASNVFCGRRKSQLRRAGVWDRGNCIYDTQKRLCFTFFSQVAFTGGCIDLSLKDCGLKKVSLEKILYVTVLQPPVIKTDRITLIQNPRFRSHIRFLLSRVRHVPTPLKTKLRLNQRYSVHGLPTC